MAHFAAIRYFRYFPLTSEATMLSPETIARARSAHPLLEYIQRDTGRIYCQAARTGGGEFAGPCPFCGGGDDRFRVWPHADPSRWWCRRCNASGDLIAYVQQRTGLVFADAVTELLGGDVRHDGAPAPAPDPTAPDDVAAPAPAYRAAAADFAHTCMQALWAPGGERAMRFLMENYGLSPATIEHAGIGYHDEDRVVPRELWGLPAAAGRRRDGRTVEVHTLFLPRGIVIPWEVTGQVWKLVVRRPLNDPKRKYYQVPGGSNCLYRADGLASRRPALMTEAALDALAVWQAAADLVAPVASGTTGARRVTWIMQLAQLPAVLLAFDNDPGGDTPTAYWRGVLPNAHPWSPYYDDPAAMLAAGGDEAVRAWVEAGLLAAREGARDAA